MAHGIVTNHCQRVAAGLGIEWVAEETDTGTCKLPAEVQAMAVDPKLLEILVCPVDKTPLEVVELPEAVRHRLIEKYRDQFKGEEPVVEIGLASPAGRVYPVVSGIPVMLVDDALTREEIEG
jgi:uncharacterized protein YbaR (Trm112 family)